MDFPVADEDGYIDFDANIEAILQGVDLSIPLSADSVAFTRLAELVALSPDDDEDVSEQLTEALVGYADIQSGMNGWVFRLLAVGVNWPEWWSDCFWPVADELACDIVARASDSSFDLSLLPHFDSLPVEGRGFLDLGLVANSMVSREVVLGRLEGYLVDPVWALAVGHPALMSEDVGAMLQLLDKEPQLGWWLASGLLGSDGSTWPEWQRAFGSVSERVIYGANFWAPFLEKLADSRAWSSGASVPWVEQFDSWVITQDLRDLADWRSAHSSRVIERLRRALMDRPELGSLAADTQWPPALCAVALAATDYAVLEPLASSPLTSIRRAILTNLAAPDELKVAAALIS